MESATVNQSQPQPQTPTMARGITVQPRQPDFIFDNDLPDHWFDGDAGITAFWNAFGVLAALAETRFISTGRWLLAQVDNPALQDELSRFIQQEANHGAVHARFNRLLEKRGYPVSQVREQVEDALQELERRFGHRGVSAMGVAGEQMIGEIGHEVMANPSLLDHAASTPRAMLMWHFYEEVEHQAALYDGWRAVCQDAREARRERIFGAIVVLGLIGLIVPASSIAFCRHTAGGSVWRLKTWRPLWRHLFGGEGLMRNVLGNMHAMMRPEFHPFDLHDPARTIETCRDKYTRADWSVPVRTIRARADEVDGQGVVGWRRYVVLAGYCGYLARSAWRISRIQSKAGVAS